MHIYIVNEKNTSQRTNLCILCEWIVISHKCDMWLTGFGIIHRTPLLVDDPIYRILLYYCWSNWPNITRVLIEIGSMCVVLCIIIRIIELTGMFYHQDSPQKIHFSFASFSNMHCNLHITDECVLCLTTLSTQYLISYKKLFFPKSFMNKFNNK